MKSMRLILLVLTFFTLSVSAQVSTIKEAELPEAVKTSFMKKFPKAKGVTWRMNNERYDAVFKSDGNIVDAHFAKEGDFSYTETVLRPKNLPAIIVASIHTSEYADWKMVKAAFVETFKHATYYKVAFLKGSESKSVLYDTDGNVASGVDSTVSN